MWQPSGPRGEATGAPVRPDPTSGRAGAGGLACGKARIEEWGSFAEFHPDVVGADMVEFVVDFQTAAPGRPRGGGVASGQVSVPEPVEGLGLVVAVTELLEQRQRRPVAVDRARVVAELMVRVAE